MQQRKLISFDFAIKKLLRSKANFEILEGFLSELLFEDITILEILESASNKESKIDKSNILDIKVKNNNDEIIIIEVQYSSELDYLQRIAYATSKTITEHMKEGDSYSNIHKVISVSILYFDFGDGDDYIYKGNTSFIGLHNKTKLKLNEKQQELYKVKQVEDIYPEHYLIKVKNFNNNSKDTLDEWIHFLKNEEIANKPKAKGLLKAKEKLDYLKMSQEEKEQYEHYKENKHHEASIYESTYVVGEIMGIKKGIKRGIEQGEKQKAIEVARNCIKQGLDIETIRNITGLSDEEIKDIS